jgi:hypothetical protein
MNAQSETIETLIDEIARYLAAVDVFRAERCEPKWLPEPTSSSAPGTPERVHPGQVHAAH